MAAVRMIRVLTFATMLAVLTVLAPRSARAEAEATFALAMHVAHEDGAKVASSSWLDAQIAEANRLFAPNGVRFRWTLALDLADRHRELHSRDDRDALSLLAEPGTVDVFVVSALEDVDEPGRYRMGVCWTARSDKKRYIVLASHAHRTVLAHELGHFFGNPHSPVADNVMSYTRTGAPVFFDDAQSARVRALARRFLASGRLVDVGPPWRRLF
jgi:hypothetical protein